MAVALPCIAEYPCPICGGRDGTPLGFLDQSLAKYGVDVCWMTEVLECQTCKTVYQRTRPSDLMSLYGRPNKYEDKFIDSRESREVATVRIARLLEYRLPAGALLDLGAGAGHFAREAARHFVPTLAQEVNPGLCRYMRERGGAVEVVEGDFFESCPVAPSSLDVLTAYDVFEHLHEPARLLRLAAKALKPGGLMVICTQDPDYFEVMSDFANYAEHFLATPRTAMRDLLGREGFLLLGEHYDESTVRSPHRHPNYLITYFARFGRAE